MRFLRHIYIEVQEKMEEAPMSEKARKVTHVGVVKESSELRKEREIAKQGGRWPEQPTHEKKSPEAENTQSEEKDKEKG
jgi:hypothetical protein